MAVDRISISVDMSTVATTLDLGMIRAGRVADGDVSRQLVTSGCGGAWLELERGITSAGFE